MRHCVNVARLALNRAFMQFGFMFRRTSRTWLGFVGLIPLAALLIAGCGKPDQPLSKPSAQPPSSKVVLATHWIGKARMAQDTNASFQMEIWNLPESVRLEEQTLDKLARALPTLLGVPSSEDTSALTGVIRPLLDDLVQAESFTEVRTSNNQPAEFVLAIRLSSERLALWQTNIAALNEALAGSKAGTTRSSRSVQFSIAGDWAVLGLGSDDSAQFTDYVRRLSGTNLPVSVTNSPWVVVDADLSWLLRSNSIFSVHSLPSVHLTLAGEGQIVRTRADLTFPQPLEIKLEPWQVPTNLIYDPLASFTAMRGLTKWLTSARGWNEPALGSPSQLFTWSMGGTPLQTYFAFPDPEASNRVARLATALHERTRPYFATNAFGRLERTATGGLNWVDFPFLPASLEAVQGSAGNFVVAGWSPGIRADHSPPQELLAQFLPRTNLVYYDWELTESRVDAWTYLGQTLRLAARWAQLPRDGAAQKWLRAMSPKLGNCVTVAELSGDRSLSVTRTATVGFTALELHLLADWLESPDFPRGLHSLNSQPDPRLYRTGSQAGVKTSNDPLVRPGIPP